jgi:hypothetical protein
MSKAPKYVPKVYPVEAIKAIEEHFQAHRWLRVAVEKVELLVAQKKTPQEIWAHLKEACETYDRTVNPKED